MRIGLVDVNGHNFPNLALMKLSAFHKKCGDYVDWHNADDQYDRVYMSKVFDSTYTKDVPTPNNAKEVIRGGTGYDLQNKLNDEIEHQMPDYSLYGITDTAYGFLTRGCPRHCGFCIVGDKEGLRARKVADLDEWWSGQPNIKLLDPNLLASKDRMSLLDQLIESRAMVDITQGFDIRLANEEVADKLGRMRVKRVHFAWDNPKDNLVPYFESFAKYYRRKAVSTKVVYVLTNYDSTLEEDLYRIYTLRDLRYDPYVMVYDKPNAPQHIRDLQRWVNNKVIFRKCVRFEDYRK